MKTLIPFLTILLLCFQISGCGKSATTGNNKSNSTGMKAADLTEADLDSKPGVYTYLYDTPGENKNTSLIFLFISAGREVYLLMQNQTQFHRSYMGPLQNMGITFQQKTFTAETNFGAVHGTQIACDDSQLSDDLKLLCNINQTTTQLRSKLNASGIAVDVNPTQDKVSFNDNQRGILEALCTQPDSLIALLKKNNTKTFEINDYNNSDLYVKNKVFGLPSGLSLSPAEALSQLKSDTLTVRHF